jgi:hypothetical protein
MPQVRPVNPVKTPLPNAPHFKLYCMYGVGTPTERGYHYLKTRRNGATEWSINSMVNDPASGLVRVFGSFEFGLKCCLQQGAAHRCGVCKSRVVHKSEADAK